MTKVTTALLGAGILVAGVTVAPSAAATRPGTEGATRLQ